MCTKHEIDAILIINGVDGGENNQYKKLTNWLFLGTSGIEIEENQYIDQCYNDLVMLICPN